MKIRKAKGADPDEIEKIGIAGYVLNGTSDVQPAIPFFEKIRNEGRALCLQEMQAYGGYFCRDFLHNEKDKTRIFAGFTLI